MYVLYLPRSVFLVEPGTDSGWSFTTTWLLRETWDTYALLLCNVVRNCNNIQHIISDDPHFHLDHIGRFMTWGMRSGYRFSEDGRMSTRGVWIREYLHRRGPSTPTLPFFDLQFGKRCNGNKGTDVCRLGGRCPPLSSLEWSSVSTWSNGNAAVCLPGGPLVSLHAFTPFFKSSEWTWETAVNCFKEIVLQSYLTNWTSRSSLSVIHCL